MSAFAIMGIITLAMIIISVIGNGILSTVEKNKQDNLLPETKEKLSNLRKNFKSPNTLKCGYMDKNDVVMILSQNTFSSNRMIFVLKETKTDTFCIWDSHKDKLLVQRPNYKIIQLSASNYHYNEEKLVYTGATVGGVTMGGFHVEGGDYSVQKYLTNKYAIACHITTNEVEDVQINEIYLNSDLLKKAKDSNLKQYIVGRSNLLHLRHKISEQTQKELDDAALLNDPSLDGFYAKRKTLADIEANLTEEECTEILCWLVDSI